MNRLRKEYLVAIRRRSTEDISHIAGQSRSQADAAIMGIFLNEVIHGE
jgi:hypothetical protein